MRRAVVEQVRALFNDASRGEAPVVPSDDAMTPPGSVIRRVHGDVVGMMVGGYAALMMQMLHPEALAGVWDHSGFRTDPLGRLRRTARFIAITTFAHRDEATAAIARVNRIHDRVAGTLPDGTPYTARDPATLAWVHATETACFLAGWRRFAEPAMRAADRDRYCLEAAPVARALGAAPVATTERGTEAVINSLRSMLRVDDRTREVARFLTTPQGDRPEAVAAQRLLVAAAIDLMPVWARRMHGLDGSGLGEPLVRAGTQAVGATLRWAFGAPRPGRA